MSFLSSGHERPLEVGARRIVCDELHVESAATGVVGGPGGMGTDPTFNSVTTTAGLTAGGAAALNGGATIAPGQMLTLAGASVAGSPTFTGGLAVAAGQTLALAGATLSGTPTLSGGATVAPGQTLVMASATLSGAPTLSGGATIAPGQTLTMNGATLSGTGAATISVGGNITTTGGVLTAPTASLPAITDLVSINGSPYMAGGVGADPTFNSVGITTTLAVGGAATLSGGATVAPGQTLAMAGATLSGAPTLSGGATVAPGQTLALAGATLSGAPTLSGGATVAPGQTLTMAGATLSGTPTFSGGATIAAGQTLTINGATVSGTGAAAISVGGNITTTAGVLTAPTASLPAITDLVSINGSPYSPGGLDPNPTFNSVGVTTTLAVGGAATFSGGATVAAGQTLTINGATLSGTGAAAISVGGNITTTAGVLTAPTASLPAITDVVTINGSPYSPGGLNPGGAPVDVANGLVFPTMTIPAAGTGTYRVTNASLAGMANNAPNPGAGNGGPAGAGIAFVTGFAGDTTGRTELLLFNASRYVLRFAAPIVSISTRGRLWFPGTRARVTRPTAVSAAWVVEVDDLHFQSTRLTNAATFASSGRFQSSSGTLTSVDYDYEVHAYSDAASDDLVCRLAGSIQIVVDRTGDAAASNVTCGWAHPVGVNASGKWSALPGFLPAFGTLDQLELQTTAVGYAYRGVNAPASGAQIPNFFTSPSTFADFFFVAGGVGGVVTINLSGWYRATSSRYTFVSTF